MSKDEGPEDLLVEAIGEFRLELIEWIDFQLNLLSEREAWPMAGSAGAIAPANVLAARPEPQAAQLRPAAESRIVPQRSGACRGCRIACATRFQAPARRSGPPPWGTAPAVRGVAQGAGTDRTGTMLRRINAGLLADNGQAADESKSRSLASWPPMDRFVFSIANLCRSPWPSPTWPRSPRSMHWSASASVHHVSPVSVRITVKWFPWSLSGKTHPGRPRRLPSNAIPARAAREVVLIVQTGQGMWGILIDREGTSITTQRPSRHEPKDEGDGVVTEGRIDHQGVVHSLLDAESTWRGLRALVVNWYAHLQRVQRIAASHRPGRCLKVARQSSAGRKRRL